jgi:hypothetical protein
MEGVQIKADTASEYVFICVLCSSQKNGDMQGQMDTCCTKASSALFIRGKNA